MTKLEQKIFKALTIGSTRLNDFDRLIRTYTNELNSHIKFNRPNETKIAQQRLNAANAAKAWSKQN